jgi:C-terminal processing protease CtpA/Prc
MDNKLKILKKVINIIKKNGIKKYIDNFDFKFNYSKDDNLDIFYEKLQNFLKKYHEHSSLIIRKKLNSNNHIYKNIVRYKSSKTWRKLPDFELKNNIGIIKFYKFVMTGFGDFNDPIDRKDRDKIVESITHQLDDWINNKKIKGLIIDFREHNGGSFRPVALSFGKYFDTLFRFYRNNLSSWTSIIDGKEVSTKYKSNNNYFPKPIAIIIGNSTCSSGEVSASIFYGKPNIKFFGKSSCGALSINGGYKINDNLELILTAELLQTTDKKIHYDEKLYPDIETNEPIKEAIKWINEIDSKKS